MGKIKRMFKPKTQDAGAVNRAPTAAGKLKRLFRLYALYAKMDLAWLLRDRTFAVLAILCDVLTNLSMVSGVLLLAWRFGGLGGISEYDVLFMLAYATVITGIFQVFFANCNTGCISRRIGRGQMEHMFIQPLPLSVQLMTEGFIPFSGGSNLLSGAALMIIAVINLDISVSIWWLLSLSGSLFVTSALNLGLAYLAAPLAFYAPVQAEEISSQVIDNLGYIGTFPLSGMPQRLKIALITVVPSGLLAWFPALALLGKPPLGLPSWYPIILTALIWCAALYLFRKGLNYYVKKGISRYIAMGHRR